MKNLLITTLTILFCTPHTWCMTKDVFAKNYATELFKKTAQSFAKFELNATNKNMVLKNNITIDNKNFFFTLYGNPNNPTTKEYKFFVYEKPDKKEVIGCLNFTIERNADNTTIEGKALAVIKRWRGCGLGTGLLSFAIALFRLISLNCNGARIIFDAKPLLTPGDTEQDMLPKSVLIGYYKKFGFISDKNRPQCMTMNIDKNGKIWGRK